MATLAFTLMLRLPDGYEPPREAGHWTPWRDAASIVPQADYGDPHDEPPFKRYPGTREYFSAPAQETLFPDKDLSGRSGRWLRRAPGWSVTLVPDGAVKTELGIDLLEIVRVRLAPEVTFGIAHLSIDAAQLAAWRRALGQGHRLARPNRHTRAIRSATTGALSGSGRRRRPSLDGAPRLPFERGRRARCGMFARTGPRPSC